MTPLLLRPLPSDGLAQWHSILGRSAGLGSLLVAATRKQRGMLLAIAPAEPPPERLARLSEGGLLDGDCAAPEDLLVETLLSPLGLKTRQVTVWFEESGRDTSDPYLDRIPLDRIVLNGATVFRESFQHAASMADGRKRLATELSKVGPYPVVCGFSGPTKDPSKILEGAAESFIAFSNAYDFESYIVWMPDSVQA